MPSSAHWALASLTGPLADAAIARAIICSTCIGISNGSFKEGHGTASWILVNREENQELVGDLVIPGAPSDQSSLRSELAGLYAIVLMVSTVCQHHDITGGTVTVACDGLKALYRCFSAEFHPSPTDSGYDLLVTSHPHPSGTHTYPVVPSTH